MAGTRERIVEAAAALFMERGYSASGLKRIAQSSDAPIGSLYHFFPGGKTELAAETLRVSGRAYGQVVAALLDAAPDIVTGVRTCFDGAAELLRTTDYADACPIATVALEVASSDGALRQVTAEVFDEWLASLAERFRAAGIAAAPARRLATTFVAAIEGGFLLCRAAKDTTAMDTLGRSVVTLVEAELAKVPTSPRRSR